MARITIELPDNLLSLFSDELFNRLDHIDNQLTRIISKENKLMGQAEDLAAAVAAVQSSETAQTARIDAIIALLETRPDDPLVAQAIADLNALKTEQDEYRPETPPVEA